MVCRSNSFVVIKELSSCLILGNNDINDPVTLRALAMDVFLSEIEKLKLAHLEHSLPAGLIGHPHRFAINSIMVVKQVRLSGQPNQLGVSFESKSGKAELIQTAFDQLCIKEDHIHFPYCQRGNNQAQAPFD